MEPLALSQILEASFGLMSVGVGVTILFLARRIAPVLTLFLHRRLLHLWVLVGLLIVASQFVGTLSPLFRSTTLTDIVEELVELAVLSCVALALYLLGRVEREEISSLRYSAEVDELTGLSSRSFFYRAEHAVSTCPRRTTCPSPASCSTWTTSRITTTARVTKPGTELWTGY